MGRQPAWARSTSYTQGRGALQPNLSKAGKGGVKESLSQVEGMDTPLCRGGGGGGVRMRRTLEA